MTYRPLGDYRTHEEDTNLGFAPIVAAGVSTGISLIKDSAESAAKQAERMAQNMMWYGMAMNGDRTALAHLHVMAGKGTSADHDLILSAEGKEIGPPPWGWATKEAQQDALNKYNQAAAKLGNTGQSIIPTVKAVATSPLTLLAVGGVVLYLITRSGSSRRMNF